MTSQHNTFTIPKYLEGQQATVLNLNAPLQAILEALNILQQQVISQDNKSAVLQWEAAFLSDVIPGDLVYYNTEKALFCKALAKLLGLPGAQGQSILAPLSRVLGIAISVKPNVLLRSGYYDSTVIQSTVGIGAEAGIYYLSPTLAGKATKLPGWNLRQPCISYYGDGKFALFSNYLAHDNHHHASYTVDGALWLALSLYTGSQKPINSLVYAVLNKLGYTGLGTLSGETTAVFLNGVLNTSDFVFTQEDGLNLIWFVGNLSAVLLLQTGSVVLFNNFPFAYGDSVVRLLKSASLKVSNLNGVWRVLQPSYSRLAPVQNRYAISGIINNTLQITPVVSNIKAGAGVRVASLGSGSYLIHALAMYNKLLPAQDVRLDGTQRVSDTLLTYTVFPKNATTSYIMSLQVGRLELPKDLDVSVWVTQRGPGSGKLHVDLYWMLYSAVDSELLTIPQTALAAGLKMLCTNTRLLRLALVLSDIIPIKNTLGGTLIALVKALDPALSIYIYLTGFRVLQKGTLTLLLLLDQDDTTTLSVLNVLEQTVTFNANYLG